MTLDPHATLRNNVIKRVLDGAGIAAPSQRHIAFEGKGSPPGLQALIDKVEANAYKVTDDEMSRAQQYYGDDRMFEIVVSAALGASRKRLMAGLEALSKA